MNLTTDYIISLCRLYGIVDKEKVVEIYNMQNEDEFTLTQIELIMENEQSLLKKHFIHVEGNYFIHETILMFDEFDSYMSKKAGKPYYIPHKKELLRYTSQFYFEITKEYEILVDYVAKELTGGDRERANTVVEDTQGLSEVEATPTNILDNISDHVAFESKEQVYEMMDLIINLGNNTRLWSNNGYTPSELFEIHEKHHFRPLPDDNKAKKIGRNDPCPCGSGKKYKKCCL